MERHTPEILWWQITAEKKRNCFRKSFLAHSQTDKRSVWWNHPISLYNDGEKKLWWATVLFEMQLQMGIVWQHSKVSHGHLLCLEKQEVLKQLKQKLVNFLSAWSEEGRRREGNWHFYPSLLYCSMVISGNQATFLSCYNENGKRSFHVSFHVVLLF